MELVIYRLPKSVVNNPIEPKVIYAFSTYFMALILHYCI